MQLVTVIETLAIVAEWKARISADRHARLENGDAAANGGKSVCHGVSIALCGLSLLTKRLR